MIIIWIVLYYVLLKQCIVCSYFLFIFLIRLNSRNLYNVYVREMIFLHLKFGVFCFFRLVFD